MINKKFISIFLVLIVCLIYDLNAQSTSFEDCSVSPMGVESDTPAKFKQSSLKKYILANTPKDLFSNAPRKFTVQILIDKEGTPCLRTVLKPGGINCEILKNCINGMPKWEPAMIREKKINISTVFEFYIKRGKLKNIVFIAG